MGLKKRYVQMITTTYEVAQPDPEVIVVVDADNH